MQERFVKLENENRAQIYDLKHLKEQIAFYETKISIQESENHKIDDELKEYQNASLENKVMKQRIA